MRVLIGSPSFPVNAALNPYLRVKLSAGYLVVAAADEDELGTLEKRVLSTDTKAAVVPREEPVVRYMVAAAAFAANATVYAAAAGKIDDSGTLIRGMALDAAAGDGSVVRVLTQLASVTGAVGRSNFTQDDAAVYAVPLTSLRVHDAMQTNLPATAANDDMGLITGTPGTDAPTLQGVDFGGASSDEKGAFEFVLPAEYVSGETVTVRVRAAMLTTVSDGTATVDVECWEAAGDGSVGADLCATAAQSINSLTPANKDFTITPTGLVAGDRLIVRLSFGGSDVGNVGVMIPEITAVQLLLDIKG